MIGIPQNGGRQDLIVDTHQGAPRPTKTFKGMVKNHTVEPWKATQTGRFVDCCLVDCL